MEQKRDLEGIVGPLALAVAGVTAAGSRQGAAGALERCGTRGELGVEGDVAGRLEP